MVGFSFLKREISKDCWLQLRSAWSLSSYSSVGICMHAWHCVCVCVCVCAASIVPRPIPRFSMLHVENQEGLVPHFLEFFPRVLLISGCANIRVQFEGQNKTRVGTINIATLPCLHAHCTSSGFCPKKHEICTWSWQIDLIQPHCTVDDRR